MRRQKETCDVPTLECTSASERPVLACPEAAMQLNYS